MIPDYPYALEIINRTQDNLLFTLETLRDHMISTTNGFELIDRNINTHEFLIITAFFWLLVLTVAAIYVAFKPQQKGKEMKKLLETNQCCAESPRELGWSFKITVEVQGPGGEGPHTIIAQQENTHREYAEFIQQGMPAKYAELNEEYKTRG